MTEIAHEEAEVVVLCDEDLEKVGGGMLHDTAMA